MLVKRDYGVDNSQFDNFWFVDACARIFEAKGRPPNDPLIVHVSSKQMGLDLVQLDEGQRRIFELLADAFWPGFWIDVKLRKSQKTGPLTIVSPSAPKIPDIVTSHTGFY